MSRHLRSASVAAVATLLGSVALIPVHGGLSWFGPVLLTVAFVTATGIGLRQLRLPRPLVPLVQLVAVGWAYVLTCADEGIRYGVLPTVQAGQSLADRIGAGLHLMATSRTPLELDPDLIMLTAMGVGLVAIAVDCLTATYEQTAWSGLPLLVLYSVPTTTTRSAWSAIAFVPAAIGYILLLATESRHRLTGWGEVRADARTGRRIGALVIGVAIAVPVLVPTWGGITLPAEPQFGRGGVAVASDPIADLRRNLQRGEDVDLLRYTTTGPADYLRLVVLDEFSGGTWSVSDRSVRRGKLPPPPGLDPGVERRAATYRINTSRDFASSWLPVPYPASTIEAPIPWTYDHGTLDIAVDSGETGGIVYQAESLRLDHSAAQLGTAGAPREDVRRRYTALDGEVPAAVAQQAREIVDRAGATSAYEQAVALQNWFLREFTYDTSVVPDDGDALLAFLRDRRGYCEQFAATMAIMARQLGIPARVAVGFLPGDREGDTYVVSAHDAHAWPELYFEGHGWVRFEPTPRGAGTGTTDQPSPDPTSTAPTGGPVLPEAEDQRGREVTPVGPSGSNGGGGPSVPLLAGGLVVLLLAFPAVLRGLVRRSRLHRSEPGRLVDGVWAELADTMRDLGLGWDDATTPRATGRRLAALFPAARAAELDVLVRSVERARYARTPGAVDDLPAALTSVVGQLRVCRPPGRRLLARVFPASLVTRLGVGGPPRFGRKRRTT
ncbi:transglutaminase family protein [Tenggerimyces flavus]|uniref:TransglutaminaseTgpA domain-containing protein n=1 Tax=Tenggerimyces flavus TaxID=1708749 RepID=A0ABV7Y9K2_9ACTN|nr:DUF3488 and transglutaminase-like domain-containing protein [Tenggerimyces flavus]MBM7785482.1 transglutaminase-like putative cysteine protease [Tenggerimyces flavus]